jgi:hypothetical protein
VVAERRHAMPCLTRRSEPKIMPDTGQSSPNLGDRQRAAADPLFFSISFRTGA